VKQRMAASARRPRPGENPACWSWPHVAFGDLRAA
jgi:hypothetical protein